MVTSWLTSVLKKLKKSIVTGEKGYVRMLSSGHVVNMDPRTVSEVGGDFQAGLLDGSN